MDETELNLPKGDFRIYECKGCRKQEVSFSVIGSAPIPKGWKSFEYAESPFEYEDKSFIGFFCPSCFAEMNKPFSYSKEITGERVQPPKTITPMKDKEGELNGDNCYAHSKM